MKRRQVGCHEGGIEGGPLNRRKWNVLFCFEDVASNGINGKRCPFGFNARSQWPAEVLMPLPHLGGHNRDFET